MQFGLTKSPVRLASLPAWHTPPKSRRQTFRLLLILGTLSLLLITFLHSLYYHNQASESTLPVHPIPQLIAHAEARWKSRLVRQSTTLAEAVHTYRHRYNRDPPDGFDAWYAYAKQHNHILIDEYDEMMRSLEPFLEIGPEESRRLTETLLHPSNRQSAKSLVVGGSESPIIRGAEEEKGVEGPRTHALIEMLKPAMELFEGRGWPEFRFPVAELAEPRVLAGKIPRKGEKVWEQHATGDRTVIASMKRACGEYSKFAKEVDGMKFELGIGDFQRMWDEEQEVKYENASVASWFVKDVKRERDICWRPELVKVHGVFRQFWNTTNGLYPLLTYGRPSSFGDIVIPSMYNWHADKRYTYDATTDIRWDRKSSTIFWHGDPSGGGKGDKFYGSMHRHRLMALSNPPLFQDAFIPASTITSSNRLQFLNLTAAEALEHTRISFTTLPPSPDCELFGCDLKATTLPFTPRTDFSEAWRSKLLLDTDGWGASGRFRALLQSGSLPVSSTIYNEWFSERIVEWWHYVPLSLEAREFWDVIGYFLRGGRRGNRDAKQMAKRGQQWVKEHMRKEDMTIYCARLMLELNRVFNGGSWAYKGTGEG